MRELDHAAQRWEYLEAVKTLSRAREAWRGKGGIHQLRNLLKNSAGVLSGVLFYLLAPSLCCGAESPLSACALVQAGWDWEREVDSGRAGQALCLR